MGLRRGFIKKSKTNNSNNDKEKTINAKELLDDINNSNTFIFVEGDNNEININESDKTSLNQNDEVTEVSEEKVVEEIKIEDLIETPPEPDENFDSKESDELVVDETVKNVPELNDEVAEVSEEEVVVEIEVMNTDENANNTTYTKEAIKEVETEDEKEKELEDILKEEENKSDDEKKVICLDTLEVYLNAKDAESKTPAKAGAITRNCNKNSKRAGGLRWMYYSEYLQENQ